MRSGRACTSLTTWFKKLAHPASNLEVSLTFYLDFVMLLAESRQDNDEQTPRQGRRKALFLSKANSVLSCQHRWRSDLLRIVH